MTVSIYRNKNVAGARLDIAHLRLVVPLLRGLDLAVAAVEKRIAAILRRRRLGVGGTQPVLDLGRPRLGV